METVVITGTTSGIGEAFAERSAQIGSPLVLVARNQERLEVQQRALQSRYDVPVDTICCDLAEAGAAHKVAAQISAIGAVVDVLVNNAGFNDAGPFAGTDLDVQLNMLEVLVRTVVALTRFVLPCMLARGRGHILNVGSTASYMPCPTDAVYAASKAFVLSFSNSLHQELADTGVSVTCLCPGATRTLFAEKAGLEDSPLFRRFVMTPGKVAETGIRAMRKGKRTVTAGFWNNLMVAAAKLLPVSVVSSFVQKMLAT